MAEADDSPPVPVIDEALLSDIMKEMKELSTVPECPVLNKYFVKTVLSEFDPDPTNFTKADYQQVMSLFPMIGKTDHAYDKLLEYYITCYPSYKTLRERRSLLGVDDIAMNNVLQQWYKEFFCYLRVKLKALPQLTSMKTTQNAGMTTKARLMCPANFFLNIMGPPDLFNKSYFQRIGDDIALHCIATKSSHREPPAELAKTFAHLPNLYVKFSLGEGIHLGRMVKCSYERFIVPKSGMTRVLAPRSMNVPDDRILAVERNNGCDETVCPYTYAFLSAYVKQLVALVRTVPSHVISDENKMAMETLLNDFLSDVDEINMYGHRLFASGTSVTYVKGNRKYHRFNQHRLANVRLVELMWVRVYVSLLQFNPHHDVTLDGTVFRQLEYYKDHPQELAKRLNDSMRYTCMLCNCYYTDYLTVLKHMFATHSKESSVECNTCMLNLDIYQLAANRWEHTCTY